MIFDLFASEGPARVLDCCTGIGFSLLLLSELPSDLFPRELDFLTFLHQFNNILTRA
jgi:hypothetical protein